MVERVRQSGALSCVDGEVVAVLHSDGERGPEAPSRGGEPRAAASAALHAGPFGDVALADRRVYVRAGELEHLLKQVPMEEGADTYNLCLRSVRDDCWPFPAAAAVAPLAVVAVDLAGSSNARERRVGGELLGRLWASRGYRGHLCCCRLLRARPARSGPRCANSPPPSPAGAVAGPNGRRGCKAVGHDAHRAEKPGPG